MDSQRDILVGRVYKHFKGMNVITLALPIHTETGETMVMYKCLKDGVLYVRPYNMFVSEVDHEKYPDIKQRYRFELVDDNKLIVDEMISEKIQQMLNI